MQRPKISVIIPVFNAEKYLKRCLDSVLNQTFNDLEIILINDGSKDSSPRICDEYKEKDSRIKVIHQANGGAGFSRNNGLKIATGEYVSFVDSDDYLKLDTYEKLIEAIKTTNAETCIFSHYRIMGGSKVIAKTNAISGTFKDQEALENVFLNALGTDPSSHNDFVILWQSPCLSLYSLDLIRKENISFPSEGDFVSFSEDVLFNFDYFSRALNVTILKEAFYHYCMNPGTATTRYNENRFILNVKLYKELLRRATEQIKNKDLLKKAEERMHRTFLAAARNCIMFISAFFSYKDGRQRIKDICDDPTLKHVLSFYPWNSNPFRYRLFNYGLDRQKLWFLYLLGKMRKSSVITVLSEEIK